MESDGELKPPRPSRRRILVRRIVAGVAAVLVLGGIAAALAMRGSSDAAPPPTTTIRQLRQFRVVFPEGFTRAQMAARAQVVAKIAQREGRRKVKLSGKAYLAASKPQVVPGFGAKKLPLEGFLFPDTYDFDRKSTSAQLVEQQLQEFAANWHSLNLSYARSKNLTPYDVLTIASMIEGEAQVPSERPLIAAVIYNRLHDHMSLGIDATLRYGLHIPPTKSLSPYLESTNPYNTRKFPGLPPTPINNPGLASLQAAAHPAHVDYLYFVRKPDHRHHYFTADSQDFVNHEIQYGYTP